MQMPSPRIRSYRSWVIADTSNRPSLIPPFLHRQLCENPENPEPQNFPLAWKISAIPAQSLPLA